MRIIERIVESEGSPNQVNDLWLKANGDNVALKYFHNGKWTTITGGSSVSSDDVDRIVSLTQSEYDGIVDKDPRSLYIITDTGKLALGSSMISGTDGVGVESVVQTTVSQDDGGTNVWTITLTNGQTSTLSVKNGNQGNSGYSGAAGELEVVNNLIDGGATSALSAEMGKTLNTEVSQLRSEVYKDLPFTKDKYYVNLSSATVGSTYQFAELSFSPFAYWVIPCKEGDQFKLTTSSNTATAKAYAILDKNNVVLAVQQTKVTDFDLVIPAGGATLIVNTATANPYMVRTQRYATKEELAEVDERLSDEIDNIAYTVDPILENPLRGVDFGTTAEAVKSAITKIWLQSANPANVPKVIANAPKLYIRYISNATGANRPTVLINDTLEGADTDAVISYALSSQSEPRAVKEIIRAKTLGGTNTAWGLGTDGANVYIEIDWSKISGTIRNLEIELNTANLQKMEVDRVALSDVSGPIIQGSLYGKNIVCFGDSLTELADLNSFRYSDYLAAFSGANIVNVGIGGAQLRQRLEPVTTPTSNSEAYAALDVVNMIQASIDQDFTKQVAAAEYLRDHASDDNTEVVTRLQGINWAKVDVVTIFAGTNDWYSGSNIGTTGTVGKSTTIGAINYIIQNLLGAYPHVKIFWFTPVVRWVSYTGDSGTAENFGDTYQAGGYTLKEFAALVETEVRLSHLPVCDLYNTLGWNMWNFSNYFPSNDGTHPRKPAGMRGIAARMFGFLTSHKNY